MEKNYVIMQYEQILQQLNIEFHRLLNKSKETDESLLQKESALMQQQMFLKEREEA